MVLFCSDFYSDIKDLTQILRRYLNKKLAAEASAFPADDERMYPCSTKTREVLGNPSPTPERFPEGNLKGRGKSRGRRGWIFQYLPSFGRVRTISHNQFFYREWIRKSFPVGSEGLTVLKSIHVLSIILPGIPHGEPGEPAEGENCDREAVSYLEVHSNVLPHRLFRVGSAVPKVGFYNVAVITTAAIASSCR